MQRDTIFTGFSAPRTLLTGALPLLHALRDAATVNVPSSSWPYVGDG